MTQDKGLPFEQAVLTNAFRDLPNYVFCKDTQLVYRLCNDPFVEYAGFQDRNEIIGKTDREMPWGQTTGNLYIHEDLKILKTGQPMPPKEVKMSFPGKQNKILLVSKKALRDDKNCIVGILGIYIDITERKHQEVAIREALKLAEAAVEAKSVFIANMSHDLRTPITGILGMVQDIFSAANETKKLYVNTKDDHPVIELIHTVERDTRFLEDATYELLNFCNNTLEIARLGEGQEQKKMISFDIRKLASRIIKLLTPIAHNKNLDLLYNIDQRVPTYLNGFPDYIDKILLNIVSNALKFTATGSVIINIYIGNKGTKIFKTGEEFELNIDVIDTGIGIAEENFEAIFDRFSRLTPSYEGVYKGAGLGLYTVKNYVATMNGQVTVRSELDKGSCFTVKLPITIGDQSVSDEASQAKGYPTINKPITLNPEKSITNEKIDGSSHILVVEDNLPAAMAVRGMLHRLSYSTSLAKNGTEAVEMAKNNHYDLVLMDIGLPDFSGIEVTKKMRSFNDLTRAHIPIIALTGHGNNPETRNEALEAGMQEVLTKPAQPTDLQAAIEKYILKNDNDRRIPDDASEVDFADKKQIIDWEACVKQCGGDIDFTTELLNTLVSELKQTKVTLEEHYTNYNEEKLRAELHRVRGGVSYLRLPELEQALKVFHETVKEKTQDKAKLDKTYKAVNDAIEHFWQTWEKCPFK